MIVIDKQWLGLLRCLLMLIVNAAYMLVTWKDRDWQPLLARGCAWKPIKIAYWGLCYFAGVVVLNTFIRWVTK